ncbi:MAG TPA: putative sulfate exporter family transporter [Candidatus Saccharimonadales bacterium]|nr:putative sulfate exporter family transporter [Candidatus Saccharimonadales bacterium]
MADAATFPPARTAAQPSFQFARLLPGIALLAVIGYAGKVLEQSINRYAKAHHYTIPNIEYVLWAILLGLLISNIIGVPQIFRAGVATYEFWLKAGIVLLGSRFLLGDIAKLGGVSLALVAIEITGAIAFMTFLGRAFKLRPKLTSLLAVGSAVCGVSAIIAAKGAIEADDEDSSFSIAAILALGALALFTFPLIGHTLHLSDRAYGLWAGLAVDNTAEATAAGALYSEAAAKLAVLVKSTRNATIGFVVLAYAIYWASQGQAKAVGNKAAFLWQKFPKFVLGFLFISAVATYGVFDKEQITSLANLSRWAFLLTFAGVGLRTNFREMRKQGLRPFAVGAIGEIVIAAFTLALVVGTSKYFGW